MCSGASKRRHSSTVAAVASGEAKKRLTSPPCARIVRTALPVWCTVASCPALSSRMVEETSSSSVSFWPSSCAEISRESRSSPGFLRRSATYPRRKSENSLAARLAVASVSRVRPCMYMATIRCDQSSSCGPISTGTPSISAMMVIGSGAAKAGRRSTVSPAGKASISSFASASTRGLSRSTCRETKARLTSVRSRVWTGGSSSSMELASTASKLARCERSCPTPRLSGMPAGFCRPKRRSRSRRLTSSKPPKHQNPNSSQKNAPLWPCSQA